MPPRLLRLTPAGSAALEELLAGGAGSEPARRLGRRLVDAGLAHPQPRRAGPAPEATVVVPVRDRTAELGRCLAALDRPGAVIVVDDGSCDPAAIAAVCRRHDATLLRHERSLGPAAARNTGLEAVTTELVAFVDSDCLPEPGWTGRLAGHFADPLVAAVAPRVRPLARRRRAGVLARFMATRCPLDMGEDPGGVAPGRRVPYVPTAALLARRAALAPFDADLRHGEDVDFVWRLHDAGWRVVYDPEVVAHHIESARWRSVLARRWRYGTSAAALARRHPTRLPPLVLQPGPTAAAALLLARRPSLAAGVAALVAAWLARRTRPAGLPATQAIAWSTQAVHHAVLSAGRAGTIFAAPVLLAALGWRRTRPAALVLLIGPPLEEWYRRRPSLDPARWTLACAADDVAYGLGVWRGCLAVGTARPLLPQRSIW